VLYNREQMRVMRLASIVEIERSLGDVPSALRFRGIAEQHLRQTGVSPAEFACLLANCSATSIYHNAKRSRRCKPRRPHSRHHDAWCRQSRWPPALAGSTWL